MWVGWNIFAPAHRAVYTVCSRAQSCSRLLRSISCHTLRFHSAPLTSITALSEKHCIFCSAQGGSHHVKDLIEWIEKNIYIFLIMRKNAKMSKCHVDHFVHSSDNLCDRNRKWIQHYCRLPANTCQLVPKKQIRQGVIVLFEHASKNL